MTDAGPPALAKSGVVFRVAIAILVVAAAWMAVGLSGAWWRAPDLLNEFAPVVCLIGVVAGGAAMVFGARRRRALIVPLFVLFAASAILVLPELRSGTARCSPSTGALRFVQFNADKANIDPTIAAGWILQQKPDVIGIEEGLEQGAAVVHLLTPAFPFQVSCLRAMRCSTVILSRQPALASGGLAHGDPENRKTLSATWARFDSALGPYTVLAIHLDRPWQWDKLDRSWTQLSQFLRGQDRRRIVIVGDFNQTPWTFAMARQDRTIAVPRWTHALPTWPAYRIGTIDGVPLLPIDHVYAGEDWSVDCVQRGRWIGSDHFPVVFRLSRKAPP